MIALEAKPNAVLMLLCPLEVSCSRSVISSKGALMSVSGVRISCAVLTKKRIFSSDSFRCFLKTIPGFGGQAYLPMSTKKIKDLANWRDENNYNFIIQVDGGINLNNIKTVVDAGATDIVIGSSIFKHRELEKNVADFRKLLSL